MFRISLFLLKIFSALSMLVLFICIYLVYIYSKDLPDYNKLANYYPASATRMYSSDGKLIEEYAIEHRVFVPINSIPNSLIEAFIAVEDKNFFKHSGLDILGIIRAGFVNITNIIKNKRVEGASTITQQVVKNLLLTSERSIDRKIREAILSYMISKVFSKLQVLELYLNQIYLGRSAYGVAAAATAYFNKSVDELTLAESAFIAGLPKAPSSFNPIKNYDRSKERRDYVLTRMYEEGYITKQVAQETMKLPIVLLKRDSSANINAPYYAEKVREEVINMIGKDNFYKGGYTIITTLDSNLQKFAEEALRAGIREYDIKHGYRSRIGTININNWKHELSNFTIPADILEYEIAVVLSVFDDHVKIGLKNNNTGTIPLKNMMWARSNLKSPKTILNAGDVIVVENSNDKNNKEGKIYTLRQIPDVNGAILVMKHSTGQVLAHVGGYNFNKSKFDRVTKAERQPGSLSKPFVYLAALEAGILPNSIFSDSPVEISQGPNMPLWRPKNFESNFLGDITMRKGLEKSRNMITVRVAQKIGLDKVVDIIKRFNINTNPYKVYSMVLGSIETTLERMTTAYAIIANAGYDVTPQFIELISDRNGKIIYKRDNSEGSYYNVNNNEDLSDSMPPILSKIKSKIITDEASAYQITSILQGAVERGTAAKAKVLNKIIAGKTGTTNQSMDTWFIGFDHNVVIGTYIGFDTPKSLGRVATGATTALPIFIKFMQTAYNKSISLPFQIPSGIKLVNVDPITGVPIDTNNGILEAFKIDSRTPVNDNHNDVFDVINEKDNDLTQELY